VKLLLPTIFVALLTSTIVVYPTHATTIQVSGEKRTIQQAIYEASDGDLILVFPGIYRETIDFLGKDIEVKSIGGSLLTVVDGHGGSGVTFSGGETEDAILDGFTIMNGTGTSYGNGGAGGGIYCSDASPTISNCTISLNVAYGFDGGVGGGIYCYDSSPTITNCKIIGNSVEAGYREGGRGGGFCSHGGSPFIEGCEFIGNFTDFFEIGKGEGAGLACSGSDVTLKNCTFIGNLSLWDGGAIYCTYSSSLLVTDCTIILNGASGSGGGIYCSYSSQLIEKSTITNNFSGRDGGGIYCLDSSLTMRKCTVSENHAEDGGGINCYGASGTIENCILSNNEAWDGRGGGVSFEGYSVSPLIIIHSTITGNYASVKGGGIYYDRDETLLITNCIVWENSAPAYPDIFGVPTVTYSDVTGGWPGIGNIDANPSFVSPWDHHLSPDSPCINAGTATCVHEDIDGQFRPWGSGFDMGADEFSLAPSCSTIVTSGNQFMALFMIPVLALIFLRLRFLRR